MGGISNSLKVNSLNVKCNLAKTSLVKGETKYLIMLSSWWCAFFGRTVFILCQCSNIWGDFVVSFHSN